MSIPTIMSWRTSVSQDLLCPLIGFLATMEKKEEDADMQLVTASIMEQGGIDPNFAIPNSQPITQSWVNRNQFSSSSG